VSVFLGNGDGTFQAPLEVGVGTNPLGLAAGDFNGDGFPDLVTANFGASHSLSVLLNDANWGNAPHSGSGLPGGSGHSLDLFTLLVVTEPMAAPGRSWAPPTTNPVATAPWQESTHPAGREIPAQPPEFGTEELFSWPSLW
jgi:hypothetical protein